MTFSVQIDGKFSQIAERLGLVTKQKVERAVVQYCRTFMMEVVADTPYLTGQARANWQAGVNSAPAGFIPGRNIRPPDTVDYEGSLEEALDIVGSFQLGDEVYLVNNAPYIVNLNEGSSPQGAGFIEGAQQAAAAAAEAVLQSADTD